MSEQDPHESTGDDLKKLVHAARQMLRAGAQAAAGNIPGAIIEAAKSEHLRNFIIAAIAIVVSPILILLLMPTSMRNQYISGSATGSPVTNEMQNIAYQINAMFVAEYQKVLDEINAKMEPGDILNNETSIPPFDPYKIMAYYSASLYINGKDPALNPSGTGAMHVSEAVLSYEPLIQQACASNGIPDFYSVIEAIMMQESGGSIATGDIMQCMFGASCTPEESIVTGVAHFAQSLQVAGCTSPNQTLKLQTALQNYNYGDGFSQWCENNGYIGWTPQAAQEFHDYMVASGYGGGATGQVYGDVKYVEHVLAYWNGNTSGYVEMVNVEDLLKILHTYDGTYYTYETTGDEPGSITYTVSFITATDPDFFEKTLFNLNDSQLQMAKAYADQYSAYGNIESAGQIEGIQAAPLSAAEIQNYIDISLANDPLLSGARQSVLSTGLSLVGRVPYFWGGKYPQGGMNPSWGQSTKVTAAGNKNTGSYQPLGLDCSGYVCWAINTSGTGYIDKGSDQMYRSYPSTRSPKPGDLAFIIAADGHSEHVAFYLGKDSTGRKLYLQCAGDVGVIVGYGSGFNAYCTLPVS